jgi:hypothetical protein
MSRQGSKIVKSVNRSQQSDYAARLADAIREDHWNQSPAA